MGDDKRRTGYFDPSLETMSEGKRREALFSRLKEILQYAFNNSRAFRQKMDAIGLRPEDIRTLDDIQLIPITRRTDFVERQKVDRPFGGFEAVRCEQMGRIYINPGFIIQPGPWSYEDRRWAEALYACGFRKGDIVQNTFNYHLWPFALMLDESLRMLGCTVIPAGPGNTQMQVNIMKRLGVTGFLGTPSFLLDVAQMAEEMEMDLRKDLSLEIGFAAAEMLPENLRNMLQEKVGITLRQAYGTVEVGCLGFECFEMNGMHIPTDVIVEIVDPDTGKEVGVGSVGEVVATNFDKTLPMIRWATGDLSTLSKAPCPCGRTSARLLKILGRIDQATKVRGTFIHPWQTDEVVSRHPELGRYQVIVTRKDHKDEMKFLIELMDESADKEILRQKIERAIQEILNLQGEVQFVSPGSFIEWEKKIDDRRSWG